MRQAASSRKLHFKDDLAAHVFSRVAQQAQLNETINLKVASLLKLTSNLAIKITAKQGSKKAKEAEWLERVKEWKR